MTPDILERIAAAAQRAAKDQMLIGQAALERFATELLQEARDLRAAEQSPTAGAGHCPRCGSHAPHLHPAVQHEGEVSICPDPFHKRVTPENTALRIEAVHGAAPQDGGPSPHPPYEIKTAMGPGAKDAVLWNSESPATSLRSDRASVGAVSPSPDTGGEKSGTPIHRSAQAAEGAVGAEPSGIEAPKSALASDAAPGAEVRVDYELAKIASTPSPAPKDGGALAELLDEWSMEVEYDLRPSHLKRIGNAMADQLTRLTSALATAKGEVEAFKIAQSGADERCRLLLAAKNEWMERATKAEGEVERVTGERDKAPRRSTASSRA